MSISCRPLSVALREETANAHREAEHSSFMNQLLAGDLDADAIIALQQQMLHVYTTLERAVELLSDDPRVAAIGDPALSRVQRLRADLAALGAEADVAPSAATLRYILTVDKAANEADAASIIAHHYVRYLGDLAGGQVIARKMEQLYGVPRSALTFYDFSDIGAIKPYRDRYREALDSLELTEEEREHMLSAAAEAFRFNIDVFRAVGERVGSR